MDEIVDWMSASQSITQSIPISFSISDRFLSIAIAVTIKIGVEQIFSKFRHLTCTI